MTATSKSTKSYHEMFLRNQPIVPEAVQNKLEKLRLLVAGCGSTGGAFIEGASRLGVLRYRLVEPDTYSLNNLNRQFVYPHEVGINKATAQASRLRQFFSDCNCEIEVDTDGVQYHNIEKILNQVDLVFDAVDVTTKNGMEAKLLLHEWAAIKKLTVLSALDLGYKQWIKVFDYRNGGQALDGRLELAKGCVHPLKALIVGFCPLDELSVEISEELVRLLKDENASACQLGAACHLLAAFTAPMLIRLCEEKTLPKVTSFDLMRSLENPDERADAETRKVKLIQQLELLLSTLN